MDLAEHLEKYPIAFIAVSLGNENETIASMVTSNVRLPIQKGYIVSFNIEKYEDVFKEKHIGKNIELLPYDQLGLDSLLRVKNSVITFDNLSHLKEFGLLEGREGFEIVQYLKDHGNWILVLGDQKTHPKELQEFSELYSAHFWNDKFADLGQHIKICLNKCKMTEKQKRRYDFSENFWYNTKKIIPNKYIWKKDTLDNLKRLCNIVYPPEIQTLIESCNENKAIKPPEINKMIETFGIPKIIEDAPKLQALMDKIIFHRMKRHVIYTSFSNYFGTGIIAGILNEIGIPTLIVDYDQDEETNKEHLRLFNKCDKYNVLVINKVFTEDPLDIDKYHIMDNNLPEAYEKIFKIYKYKNYKLNFREIPSLHIEMYCTSKQDGKSIDDETFDEFYPYVTMQQKFWDSVKESSLDIVPNDEHRFSTVI
jgi:hypothetical protein